jgi:hypothetical protein
MTSSGRKRRKQMELRPTSGGFFRPFGTAEFILGFLKGEGPEESSKIDPRVGAPMTDIHDQYKSALHRAHAQNCVALEEEKRIARGQPAYTEEEYNERYRYYLEHIPYKPLKMRYASFTRYFGHLKRLRWVEETGKTEPSAIQDDYPQAPPRVYYRLTEAGKIARPEEISDPITILYHYTREQRSAKNHAYTRARSKKR